MATITHTANDLDKHGSFGSIILWEAMGNADVGDPIEMPGFDTKSVQIVGTFGSATVVLQGSNDGTNYVTLDDLDGTAISTTVAGYFGCRDTPRFIRPSTSGGTGTDVDVHLVIVKSGR